MDDEKLVKLSQAFNALIATMVEVCRAPPAEFKGFTVDPEAAAEVMEPLKIIDGGSVSIAEQVRHIQPEQGEESVSDLEMYGSTGRAALNEMVELCQRIVDSMLASRDGREEKPPELVDAGVSVLRSRLPLNPGISEMFDRRFRKSEDEK